MKVSEKAYIAGLVDGEGCIAISRVHCKHGRSLIHRCSVRIFNTDPRMLEWVYRVVGKGRISNNSHRRRPEDKSCYGWAVQAREAECFLREIYPYLVIKKEQADLVFALRGTIDRNTGSKRLPKETVAKRNVFYSKMKLLKRKEDYYYVKPRVHMQ